MGILDPELFRKHSESNEQWRWRSGIFAVLPYKEIFGDDESRKQPNANWRTNQRGERERGQRGHCCGRSHMNESP